MNVRPTGLGGVLTIEPDVFGDARGRFSELWRAPRYASAGLDRTFVQDNLSWSSRGVLRGLHFQHPSGQGKLVTVLEGEVFDVAVDVRRGSPTFGQWHAERLDGQSLRQLWVPEGFAHGFYVLSERALFCYKCTTVYTPEHERCVRWNDPAIGIDWPTDGVAPAVSERDAVAPLLAAIPDDQLPTT